MTITHVGLGCKYANKCPVCGRQVENRPHLLALASLYVREYEEVLPNGKSVTRKQFFTVHTECAGGVTKNKIGGGPAYRRQPAETLEVR